METIRNIIGKRTFSAIQEVNHGLASTISRSVCVPAETQAAPKLTEGVEVHWPAGPARPDTSPADSLTADWLHSWLVPELDSLAGLEHSAPVAEYLPHGGTSGILAGRTESIPWLVAPGETTPGP